MGKLIVIDGLDGSGKQTQSVILADRLSSSGARARRVSFPNYEDESSALVKLYLSGAISPDPDGVNAYAASSFYAADRYVSYKKHWEDFYKSGGVVVADRYVTSNAVHQMPKLPREEWPDFIGWLEDFEYVRLGLPRPDIVIYLDMRPEISARLLSERRGNDKGQEDIHEASVQYQIRCREAALYAAQRLGWHVLGCCGERDPYPVDIISRLIKDTLEEYYD